MMYKIQELSEELALSDSTLRSWIKNGAPCSRDKQGHLWVNGEEFAQWISEQTKKKPIRKMCEGEAYCFHCKQVVKHMGSQVVPIKGMLIQIRGTCGSCGRTIVRGGRRGQSR